MEIESLIKEPSILTFVTTTECSSACYNCCFQCSPKRKKRLTKEQMFKYIEQVVRDFPSVISLVLTGGECTLLPDLTEIIDKATNKYGLSVRIVSNAHWAENIDEAHAKIQEWRKAGLSEINFSTGDEHLNFVSKHTITNAILASVEAGMTPFANVESQENHIFSSKDFLKDPKLTTLVKANKLVFANGVWIDFKHPKEIAKKPKNMNIPSFQRCDNLFNGITITPDNRMKACCGIISQKVKYLDLGNPDKYPLRRLFNNQFTDFIKIWLYTEGSHRILEFVSKYEDRINIDDYAHLHHCLVCAIILRNEKFLSILKSHYKEVYTNIIMKYHLT